MADEREQKRRRAINIAFAISSAVLAVLLIVILLPPIGSWLAVQPWLGFGPYTSPVQGYQREKTLWDWLDLFVVPLMLLLSGILINSTLQRNEKQRADRQQRIEKERADKQQAAELEQAERRSRLERQLARDRIREDRLQVYLDRMSELIFTNKLILSGPGPDHNAATVAATRTHAVLRSLDGKRRGIVVGFLSRAGLLVPLDSYQLASPSGVSNPSPVISLQWADLEGADLSHLVLNKCQLSQSNLTGARFWLSDLNGADLSIATLEKADLSSAKLIGADMSVAGLDHANLRGADLTGAYLGVATLRFADLSYATLKDAHLDEAFANDAIFLRAKLKNANLRYADLRNADFTEAELAGADLTQADLTGAKVEKSQLDTAKSLSGATLPDGTKLPSEDTKE